MPSFQATFGIRPFVALLLLLAGAAQAFEAKCASPIASGMVQGRSKRQVHRPSLSPSGPSARALSPQAVFAQEHRSRLGTCTVLVGPAMLGGQAGILITAIDPKQKKALLFCRGATATDCLVRTVKPREEPTAWVKGSFYKARLARGQFAYRIEKAEAGALLIILFGPDITDYLHQAHALGSKLAQ